MSSTTIFLSGPNHRRFFPESQLHCWPKAVTLTRQDWIDAVGAGLNPIVREGASDLPKSVRALRRKLKGKTKEELEHCATVLGALARRAARLVWLAEMAVAGRTPGATARQEDIDASRCSAALAAEFPEVPREAISLLLNQAIFWFYLK